MAAGLVENYDVFLCNLSQKMCLDQQIYHHYNETLLTTLFHIIVIIVPAAKMLEVIFI